MLAETLSQEIIRSTLTNGATVNYERPQGVLLAMAEPDLLREARFQICLGGDPIPSPRTPVCVVHQLEAMRTVQSMGIEPPDLYVFQSPLWQLYETKVDARGVPLAEEDIFAGSAVAAELIFRFVERFYPSLLSKVKFSWLPYNEGALQLIRTWSGDVGAKLPTRNRTTGKKIWRVLGLCPEARTILWRTRREREPRDWYWRFDRASFSRGGKNYC